MTRQIKLVFPTLDTEVIANLMEQEAPVTCETLWGLLEHPLDGRAEHGMSTGPELYIYTPPVPDLIDENVTVFPGPGDILFYHYGGQLPRGEKVYDLGIYYRRGGKGLWRVGWTAGNLCATVTQNLAGLQQAARAILNTGPQPLRVERIEPCPMPWLRDGVIQVGLVVQNLEQAVEMWWKMFGIGPWKIYNYGRPLLKFMNYQGKPFDSTWRIALTWIGPLCIELIEAGEGESLYKEFVREHGYGLHHLAVGVEDMREAIAQAVANGLTVTQEGGGHGADGSGHFAYLNTLDKLGSELELVQFPKVRVKPNKVYPPQG